MDADIFFRVDASGKIGLGHLYRCITLALASARVGLTVHFICQDHGDYDYRIIREMGFKLHLMPVIISNQLIDEIGADEVYETWLGDDPLADALKVCKIVALSKKTKKIVVCDHYGINHRWEEKVKKNSIVLTILDRPSRKIMADAVLDQTLGRKKSEYDEHVDPSIKMFLGVDYSLISADFSVRRKSTMDRRLLNEGVERILVMFGGSDPLNLTSRFLKNIKLYPNDIKYDIVCGSCNPHIPEINSLINDCRERNFVIQLHIDTTKMAQLTASSDLAIGSAGSACWERAILGLPSIIVAFENNQLDIASALELHNAAYVIALDNFEVEIEAAMHLLVNDLDFRNKILQNSSLLCDGEGANKLVMKLKEIVENEF